jgi:hypothetical protein
MPDLDYIRAEIEHMRVEAGRHRKEILQFQRPEISTEAADALLQRILDKIEGLCAERDRDQTSSRPLLAPCESEFPDLVRGRDLYRKNRHAGCKRETGSFHKNFPNRRFRLQT